MTDKGHRETFVAAFGPWGQVGAAWADAASELGTEAMRFLAERVAADVHLQQRLLRARSLPELRHIHAEFVQATINQYMVETGRIVEISEDLSCRLGLPPAC